jgi:hypothetical protein
LLGEGRAGCGAVAIPDARLANEPDQVCGRPSPGEPEAGGNDEGHGQQRRELATFTQAEFMIQAVERVGVTRKRGLVCRDVTPRDCHKFARRWR